MNFNDIKKLNEKKIEILKSKLKKDPQNGNIQKKIMIHNKIKELFNKDETVFFNISIDEAFQILNQIIDSNENVKNAYIELTSPQEYERLKKEFKI